MVHFDSVAEAIVAHVRAIGEPLPVQPAFSSAKPERPNFDNLDLSGIRVLPRLIGAVPTPRYPIQLSDEGGEVRIRFNVDTAGRPVMSTLTVVNSSDALFTAAVREVVPGMRFEPARAGRPESKPVVAAVEIGFRFTRPTK